MLKRFFINVIATIVGVFVTPNIESVAKGEVVTRWTHYNNNDEDFNFGPDRDELIARFILYMWERHHVCLSKAEVEQMLDEMDADGDEYISANPHPVFLRKTRNDHIVVGHTMRPQTASRAAMRHSRQKIC